MHNSSETMGKVGLIIANIVLMYALLDIMPFGFLMLFVLFISAQLAYLFIHFPIEKIDIKDNAKDGYRQISVVHKLFVVSLFLVPIGVPVAYAALQQVPLVFENKCIEIMSDQSFMNANKVEKIECKPDCITASSLAGAYVSLRIEEYIHLIKSRIIIYKIIEPASRCIQELFGTFLFLIILLSGVLYFLELFLMKSITVSSRAVGSSQPS